MIILNKNQNVTCAVITMADTTLFKQLFTARTEIWTQKYDEEKGVHGYEMDNHDASASYIVLTRREHGIEMVMGGCRIIYADDGSKLPIGECGVPLPPGSGLEVSRFFLLTRKRTECAALLRMLVEGIDSFLRDNGFDHVYATVRESLYHKLELMGVTLEPFVDHDGQLIVFEYGGKKFISAKLHVLHASQHVVREHTAFRHSRMLAA